MEDGGKNWTTVENASGAGVIVPLDSPSEHPFENLSPAELAADLESFLVAAIDVAQALAKQASSRALSTTITKLEEAQMWFEKAGGGESE